MVVRMVGLEDVRCEGKPSLKEILGRAAQVLWEGGVTAQRLREGNVLEDVVLCHAARMLGLRRIPVGDRGFVPLEHLGFYDDVSPKAMKVFSSTLELLYRGWPTPLVRLQSLGGSGVRVWAKLESYNPFSNSVKDRIGWYMVEKWISEHGSTPSMVYEATSTNTGIALAAMAAVKGFRVKLFIPKTIQKASDTLLWAMGADVVRTDKSLTVEMIDDVKAEAEKTGAIHINQFENDANFEVHLRYTAKELELQLRSEGILPQAIIGGVGTSGHMSAIAFYFKNRFRGGIRVYGVQPAPGHTIPGIRRVETGMKWIHLVEFDGIVDIGFEEAVEHVLEIARRDGILVGLSSGAVAAGFKKLLERGEVDEGDYVLVFPDHGFKYVEQLERYRRSRGEG